MKLQPLFDRIIILPDSQETVTEGGIIIPDTTEKERIETGKVLAIGPGYWEYGSFVKTQVNVGDKILFGKYAGSETEIDGYKILIMKERDIIAILQESKDGKSK